MTTDVKQLYITVWKFRSEAETYWKTPDPADSFRFAYCESGEALDNWIRLNDPDFSRNRVLEVTQEDILDELADTAMMILTALGPEYPIKRVTGIPKDLTLDDLCTWISDAWAAYRRRKNNQQLWGTMCIGIVQAIADFPEMNLQDRLEKRLARIKAKHEPQAV